MIQNDISIKHLALEARRRLIRMHYESTAGHLGGNLSCLDILLTLQHLTLGDNDRLILSKGHSAGALYVSLWSKGSLSDQELTTFHKDDTRLAGHPMSKGIEGVEFGTGSLGHGLSLAAGMAKGAKLKQADGQIYCLCSDGEWQEGSTWEALIFAAHNALDNLTVLIDMNGLQGFGETKSVASMQDLEAKIAGFGVGISRVDGHDFDALQAAIEKPADGRPKLLFCETVKGKGISDFENKLESHYLPITPAQFDAAMTSLT